MLPIRARLTLWYVFLLAGSFITVAALLLVRFRRSLEQALDSSLQITISQTIAGLEVDEDLAEMGRLVFEDSAGGRSTGFAIRLVSASGESWDTRGDPQAVWGAAPDGFSTQSSGSEASWRVLSIAIYGRDDRLVGWVQASQSLEDIAKALAGLRTQLLWGIPVVLLLAGGGGYFLAGRALSPIRGMTAAARNITANDLSQRIEYTGPADEIGDLARTFDAMLARLDDAFRRERRFTDDAAHELRTPLTALKGQLEVTLSRPRSASDYSVALGELAAEVDRLIALSNALLFLSQLADQHRLEIDRQVVDLREILEVISEQFAPLAEESELHAIDIRLPQNFTVSGDADHLTRIFLNLFDNAVNYTPPGGSITIVGSERGGRIAVSIQNSGSDISAEHLSLIFERFYRADAGRSRSAGGAGLGLNIVRELVHLHGGEIQVTSEPGRGVTFTVFLPGSWDERRLPS